MTTGPAAKRARTMGLVEINPPAGWRVESSFVEGAKCIGTHDGCFHCDEALACGILKTLPEWADAVIVRTRNPEELAKCHAVVDVGGTYDPATLRFDHHQGTFSDTLSEEGFNTRLSSAGLVYRHYGKEFLKTVLGDAVPDELIHKASKQAERCLVLYKTVYQNFMEQIDGIDNGVNVADGPLAYRVSDQGLSARVGQLYPRWNEDGSKPVVNERFKKGMALALSEMTKYIEGLGSSWWPARSLVEEALAESKEVDPNGEILVLKTPCPWKGHLLDIEAERGITGQAKFVLYPDSSDNWRVQAVPVEEHGFALRLSLAKVGQLFSLSLAACLGMRFPSRSFHSHLRQAWCGVRDEDLSKASGIPGCIFVHVNGFIGGNKTREGALEMARKSLAMKK
ncbi:unnamed protein product [Chrysoparadoxa australica]